VRERGRGRRCRRVDDDDATRPRPLDRLGARALLLRALDRAVERRERRRKALLGVEPVVGDEGAVVRGEGVVRWRCGGGRPWRMRRGRRDERDRPARRVRLACSAWLLKRVGRRLLQRACDAGCTASEGRRARRHRDLAGLRPCSRGVVVDLLTLVVVGRAVGCWCGGGRRDEGELGHLEADEEGGSV